MEIFNKKLFAKESGQSMVEFAIAFIFLLFFLIGIFEMFWLMGNQLLATNAAREGARYAAVHDIGTAAVPITAEVNSTKAVATSALILNTTKLTNFNVAVLPKTDATLGSHAEITVSYKVTHLTGMLNMFGGLVENPFPISATVKMRRET